jgi:L-malate glycosyltransferase
MIKNLLSHDFWIHFIYSNKILALFIHWVFQGILYADRTEKIFRIFIDIIFTLFFYFILSFIINTLISIIVAFIIAHTINSIFNGQMFVVARHFGRSRNPHYRTNYIKRFKKRISKEKSIQAAAIYGSFSRGEAKFDSDIDVRIIRKSGVINGIRACSFGLSERSRALFDEFPLDLYVIDGSEHLLKLRIDEVPLVLHDPIRMLEKIYGEVDYLDRIVLDDES